MQAVRDKFILASALGIRQESVWKVQVNAEALIVAWSVFSALAFNGPFFSAVLKGQLLSSARTWGEALALLGMLTGLHVSLLAGTGLVARGWVLKMGLAAWLMVAALASHFMKAYGIVLDPSMLRNVLQTHPAEASELLNPSLALHLLLYAAAPLALLLRVQPLRHHLGPTVLRRGTLLLMGLALFTSCLLAVFPSFGPLMRNQKSLRYLVTPANVLWSTAAVLAQDLRSVVKPRQPIGLDAQMGPRAAARTQPGARPLVVVMVVGETARAANWGLSGYPRNTTPELARWPLLSWRHATACGTNTETSVPCMLAPVGRRNYDEDRIRGHESLLHVLARAGVAVHWHDNQSGCKGTCDGLPQLRVQELNPPGLCEAGQCLDEGLLVGLEQGLQQAQGTQVWVLHMLGNHGPAYFKRYPAAFERFQPACRSADLRLCSREEIVNAYDNALLYTDHVLARLLTTLQAARGVDSAVVFASDHGESLGENNLYLHGLPYLIAPDVQKQVPMWMWLSPGLIQSQRTGDNLDGACLQALHKAAPQQVVAHDHIFHTVLGLSDVRTGLYEPAWDLLQTCRRP